MDELRNRYRVPRRDYTEPPRRPMAPAPQPVYRHPPQAAPVEAAAQPQYHPPEQHQPAPAPMAHHQATAPRRRSKKRRLLKLFIFLVVLGGLAGGGLFAHQKYFAKDPFPSDIRQNASVDLLYPSKLPAGYKVDPTSIQQTNGILIYDAVSGSQRLVFTIQKTPPTFDFNTFYKQQFKNLQQLSTTYGAAAIGQNSGRYLGSLVDGDTWLLLSTNNSHLSAVDFSLVLSNLKKY